MKLAAEERTIEVKVFVGDEPVRVEKVRQEIEYRMIDGVRFADVTEHFADCIVRYAVETPEGSYIPTEPERLYLPE